MHGEIEKLGRKAGRAGRSGRTGRLVESVGPASGRGQAAFGGVVEKTRG